jgi:hypothetical protein
MEQCNIGMVGTAEDEPCGKLVCFDVSNCGCHLFASAIASDAEASSDEVNTPDDDENSQMAIADKKSRPSSLQSLNSRFAREKGAYDGSALIHGSASQLDIRVQSGEIPQMKTVTVDDRQRVRLPDAKPGDVLAYENTNGQMILTPVEPAKPAKPKRAHLIRRNGRLYAINEDRQPITNEDVRRFLESGSPFRRVPVNSATLSSFTRLSRANAL